MTLPILRCEVLNPQPKERQRIVLSDVRCMSVAMCARVGDLGPDTRSQPISYHSLLQHWLSPLY